MARKQNRRIVVNVTEEQFEAVHAALAIAKQRFVKSSTKNDILVALLKNFCEYYYVELPEFKPEWGGNRHPLKDGGSSE